MRTSISSSTPIAIETLTPVEVKNSRTGSLGGNLVNTKGNGKRLGITKLVYEELDKPETVCVATTGDKVVIAAKISGCHTNYKISPGKGHPTIYSVALVNRLTQLFNIDFSNRTSVSFSNVVISSVQGGDSVTYPAAVITMPTSPKTEEAK